VVLKKRSKNKKGKKKKKLKTEKRRIVMGSWLFYFKVMKFRFCF